jgi:hypothetical protein
MTELLLEVFAIRISFEVVEVLMRRRILPIQVFVAIGR